MTNYVTNAEINLFKEWRQIRPNLSEDGIVDQKFYINSKLKILFLLKEVNSKVGFSLKSFVKDGGRSPTWDNIAKWTVGIQNWNIDYKWNDLSHICDIENRKKWLRLICVMNIKKTPGGHTSKSKALWKDAQEDGEFLKRQFHLYYDDHKLRPDFIIACGTITSNIFHAIVPFAEDKSWEKTSRGVDYYEFDNNKFFIRYAHPEARVADNLLYYGITDAIKELSDLNK